MLPQTEISRPLGTIKFDMLVLALEEEGEWLKVCMVPSVLLVLHLHARARKPAFLLVVLMQPLVLFAV